MTDDKKLYQVKPLKEGTNYQITTDKACFRIVVKNGKVIDAAPYGRWMIGKSLKDIKGWAMMCRFKVEQL